MNRDELVSAVLVVLDSDIPDEPTWSKIVIARHVVETIDPVIRANERKQEALRGPSEAWYDAHERAVLADLREKVEAAREQFMRVTRTPADHPMARQYDEMLALIDGSSNE